MNKQKSCQYNGQKAEKLFLSSFPEFTKVQCKPYDMQNNIGICIEIKSCQHIVKNGNNFRLGKFLINTKNHLKFIKHIKNYSCNGYYLFICFMGHKKIWKLVPIENVIITPSTKTKNIQWTDIFLDDNTELNHIFYNGQDIFLSI